MDDTGIRGECPVGVIGTLGFLRHQTQGRCGTCRKVLIFQIENEHPKG